MAKRTTAFIIGIIFSVIGLIAILNNFLPYFNIISFLFNKTVLEILITLGGIFLFFHSFSIKAFTRKLISILASLLLIFLGLFPFILDYRLIDLSFVPVLKISPIMLEIIVLFYGIYLISDSFISY